MKTTLNKIREHSPCYYGWEKLLKHLGKTKADDEPLGITTILDSNGFEDALWCLRAVEGHDREIRLYAVWCARQVQHLMTDQRSIDALDVAERYANGQATQGELSAAIFAAWDAAGNAARVAAGAAAGAAAWAAEAAAGAAAWAAEAAAIFAAGDAAIFAAWDAAGNAARVAAGAAAGNAAGNAAGAAGWDAAGNAARDAAWVAAIFAARDAAWVAAKKAQEIELRRICEEAPF